MAPSIRTEDLVRWMNDAAIDCKSIDWSAVNAAHDIYLDQVLSDRIIARERIDQLFHICLIFNFRDEGWPDLFI